MKLEIISKTPSRALSKTPLLFVHGAWHGAWCWKVHFMDFFAKQGYSVHALSLRGHGESEGFDRLRWSRIADYVSDVAQVAQELPSPPIVIGHCMGGHVVQKYLERFSAPGAILLASPPPAGALATTLRIARRHPLVAAKICLTLRLFPLVSSPALAREYLFSAGLTDSQAQRYGERLQDESYLSLLDMLALDLPRPDLVKTPMLVLGGAKDAIFSPQEVESTAHAYQSEAQIFPDMAHDLMLEPKWQTVAQRMADWLRELEQSTAWLAARQRALAAAPSVAPHG
jgi:pimeloyl-ACP methyl ester carboxylesterase